MKTLVVCLSLLWGSLAFASQNLNHIGCVYLKTAQGWQARGYYTAVNNFNLAVGSRAFLTGIWTMDKAVPPNYAICTAMVGTNEKDTVLIESYRYKADSFDAITQNAVCAVTGKNVALVAGNSSLVKKGSFAFVENDWMPPFAEKIQVREYVPLDSELPNLKKIATEKCLQLKP